LFLEDASVPPTNNSSEQAFVWVLFSGKFVWVFVLIGAKTSLPVFVLLSIQLTTSRFVCLPIYLKSSFSYRFFFYSFFLIYGGGSNYQFSIFLKQSKPSTKTALFEVLDERHDLLVKTVEDCS
jgi:hypothetical protein